MTSVAAPDVFGRVGRIATVLALVAGYLDAYAVLNHEVFVSFMSGNTTNTGRYLGGASFPNAWQALLPILLFFAGVFSATLILHSGVNRPARWVLVLVAALVAVSLVGSVGDILASWLEVTLLAFAMGMMNPTVTRVGGQSVGLGYVTGTLNSAAQSLALAVRRQPVPGSQGSWDTNLRRVVLLLGVWASFLVGAVFGSLAMRQFDAWALLLPAVILVLVAILAPPSSKGIEKHQT